MNRSSSANGYDSISNCGSLSANSNAAETTGCGYEYKRWLGIRRSTWLLFLYTAMYVAFLVSGAVLLADIEYASDEAIKAQVFHAKDEFLRKHPSVRASDLEKLLSVAVTAQDNGLSPLDADRNATKWNLGDAVLFTVSLVTTIGYGQVSPLTFDGKLFCLLYVLVGVPFSLVLLSASVERLLEPARATLDFFFWWLSPWATPLAVRCVHLAAMSIIFTALFVLTPAAVFTTLEEKWNYLDSVYFVVISLTTVGLGDLVPGRPKADFADSETAMIAYRISVAVFLLLGLIFLTLTATVFYDIPQLNLGSALHHHMDLHVPQQQQQQQQLSRPNTPSSRSEQRRPEQTSLLSRVLSSRSKREEAASSSSQQQLQQP